MFVWAGWGELLSRPAGARADVAAEAFVVVGGPFEPAGAPSLATPAKGSEEA